jgi:hypothetical protein
MKGKKYLLQLIAANGGRIHRGDLHKAVNELIDHGLLKVEFDKDAPNTIARYTEYDYVLTTKSFGGPEKVKSKAAGLPPRKEKRTNKSFMGAGPDPYGDFSV